MKLIFTLRRNIISFLKNSKFLLTLFFVAVISTGVVKAQSVTLTTTIDENNGTTTNIASLIGTPGGAGISLREAILAANNEPNGSVVTITMPPGTFIVSIAGAAENLGVSGDIDVNVTAIPGMKTVTINGAGAGTTVITGSTGERVFDVHAVNNTGSITFNLSGVTISGTILAAGSGPAMQLGRAGDISNISNCVFSGNSAPNSGAITQSSGIVAHDLTVTNCTFTNNTATTGGPGALNYNGIGNVSITGCTFSGNTAAGQGGAINITGGGAGPVTTNILRNTFINNTANGTQFGGAAVSIVNAQTVNINFNRLSNNTSPNLNTALPPNNGDGRVITAAGGTIGSLNVDNNWWGVNTGPVTTANSRSVFGATTTRWLNLGNTATPSLVCVGTTSTITASFLANNLSEAIGVANLTTVIGQPITFNSPVNGTLSAAQPSIQASGTATVTFTATFAGSGSANAVFVPAVENFTVTTSPTITIGIVNTAGAPSSTPTLCINTPLANITHSTTGATGIGAPSGLPAGVSASWALNVITIIGTPSASGTFNYNIPLTGGCGTVSATGTINVTPNNTVTLTSGVGTNMQTVNVGTPITNITYATTGATGIGAASGLPAGVTAAWALNVITIIGTPSASGIFNYSIPLSGGCGTVSANGSITVSGCAVTGSGTTTPVSCAGGSNGTANITLAGTGAGAPGTYTVDGSGSQPYTTNPFTVTGLTAGNHTIVATVTAGGCVSSNILVNVGSTTTFAATIVKTNLTSCSGTQDGTITVTPTGGTAPYTYAWTGITGSGNPATTVYPDPGNVSSISGLNIGFYNVTVTDAGGCVSVVFNNIHVQFAFAVFVTNSGSASSSCGNTGSVLLYGNAGIIPYTYALVPGSGMPTPAPGVFQSGNSFTGLAAGPYTGFIKDDGGCVSAKNITVGSIPAVVANPFAIAASSCNPDGSIQIFKSGGVGPFMYSLDGGPFQTSNFFPGLAAGPYMANVKDGNGCTGSTSVTVGQGAGLTVTAQKTNTSSCVTNGTIQVNVTGGVAPYMYSINGGLFQSSNTFNGLGASSYAITVKDFKNCTGTLNVTINVNLISVTATPTAASSCAINNGKIQLFRTGGTGPFMYSLTGNPPYQSSNMFIGLAAGTYDGYVQDVFGCIGVINGIVVGPTCAPPPIAGGTKYSAPVASSASLKVNAYPNPGSTGFTLQLDGYDMTKKVSVTITDLLGRKVYQAEGKGKMQYRFGTEFIKGMYNVQVIQGSDKKSLKLVKE